MYMYMSNTSQYYGKMREIHVHVILNINFICVQSSDVNYPWILLRKARIRATVFPRIHMYMYVYAAALNSAGCGEGSIYFLPCFTSNSTFSIHHYSMYIVVD